MLILVFSLCWSPYKVQYNLFRLCLTKHADLISSVLDLWTKELLYWLPILVVIKTGSNLRNCSGFNVVKVVVVWALFCIKMDRTISEDLSRQSCQAWLTSSFSVIGCSWLFYCFHDHSCFLMIESLKDSWCKDTNKPVPFISASFQGIHRQAIQLCYSCAQRKTNEEWQGINSSLNRSLSKVPISCLFPVSYVNCSIERDLADEELWDTN